MMGSHMLPRTATGCASWLASDVPHCRNHVGSKNPAILWENRYAHHRHACLALFSDGNVRSVIREHYKERVDDVLMRYSLLTRTRDVAIGLG